MVIDIIDLESEEFSNLTPVQLAMVRSAQAKKNRIVRSANDEKRENFLFMLSNRNARSSALRDANAEVDVQTDAELEIIKNDLLYQLKYEAIASEGDDYGPYRYPDHPNYSLSYPQRFLAVRNYYMEQVSDAETRLQALAMDSLAREYLGEYYQTLYELFASYCEG